MKKLPIALQLYTVRDDAEKDFIGTLKRVAEIGYAGVELAGQGGLTPIGLGRALDDLGLKPAGSHIGLDGLQENINGMIDTALAIGVKYLVVSALPGRYCVDKDSWVQGAKAMSDVGAELTRHGLVLCYHNHAMEFVRFGDKYAYDIFFDAADPECVKAEIDTCWVKYGGADPSEYIRKYADRLPLVHAKDLLDGPGPVFAEVGHGILDWDAIFAATAKSAAEWYIVEQDQSQRTPMESARMSFEFFKSKGMA